MLNSNNKNANKLIYFRRWQGTHEENHFFWVVQIWVWFLSIINYTINTNIETVRIKNGALSIRFAIQYFPIFSQPEYLPSHINSRVFSNYFANFRKDEERRFILVAFIFEA